MVLRTKWGNNFNTEKIWGVEIGFNHKGKMYWSIWNRYLSQRRMLQALGDFKKFDPKYPYRPVHINYDWEMKNLDEQSLREYKISLLLNKNEDLLC